MDLETKLYNKEQTRLAILKQRDALIERAEQLIEEANKTFDEVAVPLGREINDLRERLKREDKPADTRTGRSHKAPTLDGLDDDEQAHFQQLLARRKKR